ncbi:hypothetical protein K439DRAFT_1635027 [Ramaria rubella]|nr:hypothetical protein K439DRAFT_1635027 [Ramaria rubella]
MPKNIQIIPPKHSSAPVPPPHSYTVMQFKSTLNDDDDDICPVCESECTCKPSITPSNSQSSPHPFPALPSPPSSAPAPAALKIKLPARHTVLPPKQPAKRAHAKPAKPRQTTVGSVIVDGGSTGNYVIVHRSGPFSAPGHQLGAPPPVASTSTALPLRDTSPLTPDPDAQPSPKAQARSKQQKNALSKSRKKSATVTKAKPKSRPNATQKKATPGSRSKKNKDATWTTGSARRKGKRAVQISSDESEDHDGHLTDEDAYITRMVVDSDDTESGQFPTFVSAISTTSDNDDSPNTMTDSFDSDSSIRAEEENLILMEQRAKVRREILNGEESWHMEKRKWDHLKNNNNWEIRPRKRSVGPQESDSGTESESESEMEAQEEEEGEEDDDPDIRYGRGMVTGWQSDDDFDAELFFATLTDSSGPGSDADAEDGEDSGDEQSDNSDLSTISMSEAAAAGLLQSPFGDGCPLVVTEDWDGRLVFANGLKDGQGVLDVQFEVDAALRHRSIRQAMEVDAEYTEDTVEELEEDEEYLISDDGETTDDMLDHRHGLGTPQGIVPLPFRCPTPPVASIDPLSTFSPIVGSKRNKLFRNVLPVESPKPADILAAVGRNFCEPGSGLDQESSAMRTPSPFGTATTSSQSRQMPSMGSFLQVSTDPKRRAIIDGTKTVVFSPFARAKRIGKYPGRGRKRTAAGNDIFPYTTKRPRQASLPDSSCTTVLSPDVEDEAAELVQSSPELLLPATSIDLDDVLDASFLDSDDSAETAANTSGERHLRNLSRWDRVPMSTFRRSRAAHMEESNVHVSSLASFSYGVSYGSAGGHVLRRTPVGALWQNPNVRDKSRRPPGSVTVSPVIFPLRDGERTPTAAQYDLLERPIPADADASKSHKQKRKEKKKRTNAITASSAPSSCAPAPNSFHSQPPPPVVPLLTL